MKQLKKLLFSGNGIFLISMMLVNFLNFLFNAILGRALSLEEFSIFTLANTLWAIITILLNSIASTSNNRIAYLHGRRGKVIALGFRTFFNRYIIILSLILAAVWLACLPIFSILFHTSEYIVFIVLSPAIVIGTYVAVYRGYFQGVFSYMKASILLLVEAVSKILVAIVLIAIGFKNIAYVAIPLGVFFSLCALFILPKGEHTETVHYKYVFPRKLLIATFLSIFSGASFLTVDLLLARHFLTGRESGMYSLLSLTGKMIFFFGSLLNVFILTTTSMNTGLNKNTGKHFYRILFVNSALLISGFLILKFFGPIVVPLLLGSKSVEILQYLNYYIVGITLFTFANYFTVYHLAKQQYIFAYNSVFSTLLLIVGLMIFHATVFHFIFVIIAVSYINLSTNVILHVVFKDSRTYIDPEDKRELHYQNLLHDRPLLSVSICIPAYNEGKNIGKLLETLVHSKTQLIHINKIIVVSSRCTDHTDDIVKSYAEKYSQVALIAEKQRSGKACAINVFLKKVTDPIVVVQSADTLPREDTIEKLCRPFLIDEGIGMTGGAPVPVNNPDTFLGFIVHTWWWFHRNIPRFGEIVAFRNIIDKVSPRTAVDEAYIQAKFAQLGYKIVHIDDAVIHNKGSETLSDLITQRRRIFNGHSTLQEKEHVHISAITKSGIKLLLFDYKLYHPIHILWLVGGICIELFAILLGLYDKYYKRLNPSVWNIATSTKDLSIG